MRPVGSRLVLALLALAPTAAAEGAAVRQPPGTGPLTLRFARPADWRCVDRDGCTLCRNVSAQPSRVFVSRSGGAGPGHLDVPAAESLEICTQ